MRGQILRSLGPGIVTGAADDDPSGIATYSIAGAQYGLGFLWTAFLTWPLMAAVQTMCARVGMVTGEGLMSAFRTKFPRWVLVVVAAALFIANTINIGSDLSAMADAAEMLSGVSSHIWVFAFAATIGLSTLLLSYHTIGNALKWLALVLVAYVITAFLIHPRWSDVMLATVKPSFPSGRGAAATLVAILGTTISPYLFFWQTSHEVEYEKSLGRRRVEDRQGASHSEIVIRKVDVAAGTFASNVAMYFIILTTALTLHSRGMTHLATSREVASALRPLAGSLATLLYTVGILGTGALAIPTLAGSSAYAFAETFGWHQGMDERVSRAPQFYAVVVAAVSIGVVLDFTNVNPISALYWTAVINGLLAPFLLVGLLIVASDRILMHGQPSSLLGRGVVAFTTVAMVLAALGMFLL
ncbi:MAG: divalent metal cation transporter [Gemmatimonadota bacterium]|nr:divalent metal cation transporter [Gemmatimonadota bacterium]